MQTYLHKKLSINCFQKVPCQTPPGSEMSGIPNIENSIELNAYFMSYITNYNVYLHVCSFLFYPYHNRALETGTAIDCDLHTENI